MFQVTHDQLCWLLVLPFFGTLLTFLAASLTSSRRARQIGLLAPLSTFIWACVVASDFQLIVRIKRKFVQELTGWFGITGTNAQLNMFVDPLTITLVCGFAFITIMAAVACYLRDDETSGSTAVKINLLLFSVVLTLTAGNFLLLIAGWMTSAAIIYASDPNRATPESTSDRLHWLLSRFSDLGLIVVGLILVRIGKNFNLIDIAHGIQQNISLIPAEAIVWTTGLLLLAVIVRSGLLPFGILQTQSNGNMHLAGILGFSASLITSIYLITRFAPLFVLSSNSLTTLSAIGAVSACYFAFSSLFTSRLSQTVYAVALTQVGLIFATLGRGAFSSAVSHSLSVGIGVTLLLVTVSHVQFQLRRVREKDCSDDDYDTIEAMGGLGSRMPVLFTLFGIASMLTIGAPPFSTLSTHSEILWQSMASAMRDSTIATAMIIASGVSTFALALVMLRVFFGVFQGKPDVQSRLLDITIKPVFGFGLVALLMVFAGWFAGSGATFMTSFNLDNILALSSFRKSKIISQEHVALFGVWISRPVFIVLVSVYSIVMLVSAWGLYTTGVFNSFRKSRSSRVLTTCFDNAFYVPVLFESVVIKPLYAAALISSAFSQWISAKLLNLLGWLPAKLIERRQNNDELNVAVTESTTGSVS